MAYILLGALKLAVKPWFGAINLALTRSGFGFYFAAFSTGKRKLRKDSDNINKKSCARDHGNKGKTLLIAVQCCTVECATTRQEDFSELRSVAYFILIVKFN